MPIRSRRPTHVLRAPRRGTARLVHALAAGAFAVPVVGGGVTQAADPPPPDICLTVRRPTSVAGRAAIVRAVEDALAARPVLIPDPLLAVDPVPPGPTHGIALEGWSLAIWADLAALGPEPPSEADLAGACAGASAPGSPGGEAGPGRDAWSAHVSGEFLRAGTRRELAAAPTTPGFESSIDVEWDPAGDRVRTVLRFSGPFGIPNGTCWMDDTLAADGEGGVLAEVTTGSSTSPFGEGVCGRFEEYLAAGGAGAQAIVLLPSEVMLPDGVTTRFEVDAVDVRPHGVVLSGALRDAAP